ncbi:MAG: hypothetical protein V4674_00095 [Patescibacteria group bacterium]
MKKNGAKQGLTQLRLRNHLDETMNYLARELGVDNLDELVGRAFTFLAPKHVDEEGKQPFAFMGRIKSCWVQEGDLFLFINHGQFAHDGWRVHVQELVRSNKGRWTCYGKCSGKAGNNNVAVDGQLRLRDHAGVDR